MIHLEERLEHAAPAMCRCHSGCSRNVPRLAGVSTLASQLVGLPGPAPNAIRCRNPALYFFATTRRALYFLVVLKVKFPGLASGSGWIVMFWISISSTL